MNVVIETMGKANRDAAKAELSLLISPTEKMTRAAIRIFAM
jgi:hypothetical protein